MSRNELALYGTTNEIREEINIRSGDISDEEALNIIERFVFSHERFSFFPRAEKSAIINRIFCSLRKDLDILQPYADDEEVSEIMVNGKDEIFIERRGKIEKADTYFERTEDLEEVIRRVCAKVHREINELNPIADARLPDGSRVSAVHKNVAINGPALTIRKFPKKEITMQELISNGTISREAAEFLGKLTESGYNIFVSGGTSSGKTTFLNVLSDFIPADERVVVIEDSAELKINGIKNIVRLECRNANVQGKGKVDMRQLIKTSLRMRPNRIIVGEVRGEEVVDMIQAMNTGHDGSLSTGHGNSIEGMLLRLEAMFLQAADFPIDAIRAQIAEGIDIIVHMGRLSGNDRKVLEIAEITGVNSSKISVSTLFKFKSDTGLVKCGQGLMNKEKLDLRGIVL